MLDYKKEDKKIGVVGWVVLLIFLGILAFAVYNKVTMGS
jgi:hypothetical protein